MLKADPDEDRAKLLTLLLEVRAGEKRALEQFIRALRDGIYGIALRMVAHPADAEDVTQEVLIKVITKLDSFRGDSSPRTWAYRITVNHVLDRRKTRIEEMGLDFDTFANDLSDGLSESIESDSLLVNEVKLGCTLAMLSCLSREHRVAYVLGEVFDLPGKLAAEIASVKQEVYRQRLSRACSQLEGFTKAYCGIVDPENACRCERRVQRAIEIGRVNRDNLVFAHHPTLQAHVDEMDLLHSTAALMRTHPHYAAPERVMEGLRGLLDDASLSIFSAT